MRQTRIPLTIEHYDKILSFNNDQKDILISYHFNKIKFYGPTGNDVEVKKIDRFPFRFDIIYDSKTKMVYQGKLVENK